MANATELLTAEKKSVTELKLPEGSGDVSLGDIAEAAAEYKRQHPNEEVRLADDSGNITVTTGSTTEIILDEMLRLHNHSVSLHPGGRALKETRTVEGGTPVVRISDGSEAPHSMGDRAEAIIRYRDAKLRDGDKLQYTAENLAGTTNVDILRDDTKESVWHRIDVALRKLHNDRFPEDGGRDAKRSSAAR